MSFTIKTSIRYLSYARYPDLLTFVIIIVDVFVGEVDQGLFLGRVVHCAHLVLHRRVHSITDLKRTPSLYCNASKHYTTINKQRCRMSLLK